MVGASDFEGDCFTGKDSGLKKGNDINSGYTGMI
jgi:hypothetical protein